MPKIQGLVVLSSDEEESEQHRASKRRKSDAKNSSKPRLSRSRSRSNTKSTNIRLACDDFSEFISSGNGLWVDKYKPRGLEQLAVHKKKVEEVKTWFEERLTTAKDFCRNHVLVLTGKSGVGKSTTVDLVTSHFGGTLCEWNAPTPTIWREHLHSYNAGVQYTSKLDEFVNFIDKIRKYGMISSSTETRRSLMTLLIDDLPVTNGRVAFEKLKSSLILLVRSAQIPMVIVATDYGEEDSNGNTARWLEELIISLESAGACKIAFNPITANSIKKTLDRISKLEQCSTSTEQIDMIAKASGGDIRHAITSLQLFCVKGDPLRCLSSPISRSSYVNRKTNDVGSMINGLSLLCGRDETLSLFHALGKFLHNKREADVSLLKDEDGFDVYEKFARLPLKVDPPEKILSEDAFDVHEKFARLPLKMDPPEKILSQAHGQARPIADFLHENVLDFVSDEAMDDAWDVISYLCDADLLLSPLSGRFARYKETENILQSSAASVAVRGVQFGNFHPFPPRWHAVRKPKLWQVEQSFLRNQKEMEKLKYDASGGSTVYDVSCVATEYLPTLKWLGPRVSANDKAVSHSSFDGIRSDIQESHTSDDDIEEW